LEKALNVALEHSVKCLPFLKGRTFIAVDNSGSMRNAVSGKSTIMHIEIGALMAAMSNRFSEDGVASVFGDDFSLVLLSGNILDDANRMVGTYVGYSTNGYKAIKYLNDKNVKVDRILIFTDEELYDSDNYGEETLSAEFAKYRKINADAKLYVVNLNGYGDSCVDYKDKDVVAVSGWSDKILDFIAHYEEGSEGFIARIRNFKYSS
jgi:hypothetical protein